MIRHPAITIITPTYNRAAALGRAIASVQAQSRGDYEHIIVDDGSTDGTSEVISRIKDPRVRGARFPRRRGANAARNHGIAMARADIVTFLDSDDEYTPDRLMHSLRILEEESTTDILISSFDLWSQSGNSRMINRDARFASDNFEKLLMWQAIYLGCSGLTLRRQLLDSCGGFAADLVRMQDVELLLGTVRSHPGPRHGEWARLSSGVDWIKHMSSDSISAPTLGFVVALARLAACRPDLLSRYPLAIRFHIARIIKEQMHRGRYWLAARVYAENLGVPIFRFTPWALGAAYREGLPFQREQIERGLVQ